MLSIFLDPHCPGVDCRGSGSSVRTSASGEAETLVTGNLTDANAIADKHGTTYLQYLASIFSNPLCSGVDCRRSGRK